MHRLPGICLALLTLLHSAPVAGASTPPPSVAYEVRRLPSGDRYEVTLRFRGEPGGRSTLTLPAAWAGATEAGRGIEGLTVVAGGRLEDTETPSIKRVVHRPGAMLTIRYRLHQIAEGEPVIGPSTPYLPIVQRDYFAWIGWTAWVVPYENDRLVRIDLAFRLPAPWTFASSFGDRRNHVAFTGWIASFRSAVFVGGDFRLQQRRSTSGVVVTAVRGSWPMTDDAFADRIAVIVAQERAFWHETEQDPFLVTLVPLRVGTGPATITGTGLSNSFATFVPERRRLDDLDSLWTHEYFHTWNAKELGQFREPQALMYWFSEGFTEFYTNLLMLRRGALSLEDYVSTIDRYLRRLAVSPARATPNAGIPAEFFRSDAIGKLPYERGFLLAAQWDSEIRARSNGKLSLDDAMRALRDGHRHGEFFLDADRVARVMASYGIVDAAGDIERQIERGEQPTWTAADVPACVVLDVVGDALYDLGFDAAASERSGKVTAVRSDGPAYAAGLRETQTLRSIDGGGSANKPVDVGIRESTSDEIRVVRYFPAGTPITRQTVRLDDALTNPERQRCLASLGAPASLIIAP